MVFVFGLLLILALSTWLIFQTLFLPAALLYQCIFTFHLAIYILAIISFLFILFARISSRRSESGWRLWAGAFFFFFLGMHSLFFVSSVLSMLLIFFLPFSIPLMAFVSIGLAYLLGFLGIFVSALGPKIVNVEINKEFSTRALKLIQISDLHIGASVGAKYVKRLVSQANALNADCIVLTGDIGDGDPSRHENALSELSKLNAPLGVYIVLGNHEMYWPTNQWIGSFQKMGMNVLMDDVASIHWENHLLYFVGLAPFSKKKISQIFPITESKSIVLSHYPHRAKEASEAGALLFLAGHTHGGQFWPWSWLIYFFHQYAVGLYSIGKTKVYVNAGTGHWGPPFRFGRRAELTLFHLKVY